MQNFFKKWLAVFLAALLLAWPSLQVLAQDPMARTLSVFRVDGDNARLARTLGGTSVNPRDGQRLSVGNVMITGDDTQMYMQLDTDSIVKMDELSYVAVAAAGSLVSLSVLKGSALVEVTQQAPGHSLETRIGSAAIGVRGTLFIAGIRDTGATVITMLSGYGEVYVQDGAGQVQEIMLMAGQVFWADDGMAADAFAIRPIDLHAMSLFELQETWNYREYLLEIGTITPEMLELLQQLIPVRQGERDAARAAQAVTQAWPGTQIMMVHDEFGLLHAVAGDIIELGGHSWRVLEALEDRVLVISEIVMFQRYYHQSSESVTWENSDTRSYLNDSFIGRFSPVEQALIASTSVINENNQWNDTPGGNNTTDRVFLLSIREAVSFFGDSGLLYNQPGGSLWLDDEHNEARIAGGLDGSASMWWLRSPGFYPRLAAYVDSDGILSMFGAVSWGDIGIRPAMWLYR